MTTNTSVNVGLSGATGTGNFVGANTPTLVTPLLGTPTSGVISNCTGAPTLTSLAFSSTSEIIGTNTNNNAAAGSVGEYISSQILSANATSLSNGVIKDVTSISLTAGDWDVSGNIFFQNSGLANTIIGWINNATVTLPDSSLLIVIAAPFVTGAAQGIAAPTLRFSLSTTTTIYLSAISYFSTGASTACGLLWGRRAR